MTFKTIKISVALIVLSAGFFITSSFVNAAGAGPGSGTDGEAVPTVISTPNTTPTAPKPTPVVKPAPVEAKKIELPNPLVGVTSIPQLIGRIIRGLFGVLGTLALCFFLWGGFLIMSSAGSKDKVNKGRDTMVYAALGLAAIFGSYVAVNFIIATITGNG